jgi:hypothetical protein
VVFDLGDCKIEVTVISIRSRETVGYVKSIGGVGSGRAPELALRFHSIQADELLTEPKIVKFRGSGDEGWRSFVRRVSAMDAMHRLVRRVTVSLCG